MSGISLRTNNKALGNMNKSASARPSSTTFQDGSAAVENTKLLELKDRKSVV